MPDVEAKDEKNENLELDKKLKQPEEKLFSKIYPFRFEDLVVHKTDNSVVLTYR